MVAHFVDKSDFNISRLKVDLIKRGEAFDIQKVIHITIIYFDIIDNNEEKVPIYHEQSRLRGIHETGEKRKNDDEEKVSFYKYIKRVRSEYIYIVLNNYKEEDKTELGQWLYLLKNSNIKPGSASPSVKKASDRLSKLKMSSEELSEYWKYFKDKCVLTDQITTAVTEARAEAIKEGKAIGIKEGVKEGERLSRLATASNMLKLGIDRSVITQVTGLTAEDLDKSCSA